MKSFLSLGLVAATLANVAQSHYIFEFLTANGAQGAQYEHLRKNTNYNSPVTDLASKDLRCNVGGGAANGTTTVAVKAGGAVSFTADVAVYHQGPVTFYMTKVDSAVNADGSTPWFKIKEIGPTFSGGQATWDLEKTYSVNVPTCVPNGDYLVRIEQLAIHNPGGVPQFYINCAQVTVSGGGSKAGTPTVSIPGHVKATDPGYTANIYSNFNNYTVPGPKVFTC